jgi:SecD/SecF fusion protein
MKLTFVFILAALLLIPGSSTRVFAKLKPISVEFRGEDGSVVIQTSDIQSATASEEPDVKQWAISLHFTPNAAAKFKEYTRDHVKQKLSILVDGKVMSSPVIQTEIPAGNALVTGHFTEKEAHRLVRRIQDANAVKK